MLAHKSKLQLKKRLEQSGWFIRRVAGLPLGVSLYKDLEHYGVSELRFILDIGAHVGESSMDFSIRHPEAKIIAFEPVKANFDRLLMNIRGFNSIQCINAAVGDEEGWASISLDRSNSQAHSLAWPSAAASDTEMVSVTTVDKFLERALDHCDFIKIDVEGYELRVLQGAKNILKSSVKALLIEATINPDDMRHTQLSSLQAFLTPLGFRLVGIYDQHCYNTPPQLMFFNALFLAGSKT